MKNSQATRAQDEMPAVVGFSFRQSDCDPTTEIPTLVVNKDLAPPSSFIAPSCFPNESEFIHALIPAYEDDYIDSVFHPPERNLS